MTTVPLNQNANVVDKSALEYTGGTGSIAPAVAPPSVTNTKPQPTTKVGETTVTRPTSPSLGAQLDAIEKKAYEVKARIDALNATQKTPENGIVSSSSSVVARENDTKNKISTLSPTDPNETALRNASNAYLAQLDFQTQMLEQRRQQEVAALNAQFDSAKTSLEGQQKNEVGSTTATLARIGGYLGPSASATGALINLAASHKSELMALEAKRASAINEANNAITDKQFALAKLKYEEAKEIEKDVLVRKDKFFEQNMEIMKEQRQQDEALRNKYKDELETLGTLAAGSEGLELDPAKAKEIDEFYGVPGFTQQYLEVTNASNRAKSQKEVLETQQKLLSLLKDIPAGQTIKFPDGTEYTGIGSSSDITTFQETDQNGYVRLFTYNKANGEINVQGLGTVGKPSSDGIDSSNPRIVQASNAMSELVDPNSGYVPINAYIEMYRAYVKENNGKGQEFIQNFDPLIWTGRGKEFLVQSNQTSDEEDGAE